MTILRAYLFCHPVTEINAWQGRPIICFSLSLSAVAHFAVRRIGDVVKRFLPADREGITFRTNARFTTEMKYRDGEKCAFYQNGSTAINGFYIQCVILLYIEFRTSRPCLIKEAE